MATRSSGQVGEVVYPIMNPQRVGVIIGPATPGHALGKDVEPYDAADVDVLVQWDDGRATNEVNTHLQSFDALIRDTTRKAHNHLARRAALGRKVKISALHLP